MTLESWKREQHHEFTMRVSGAPEFLTPSVELLPLAVAVLVLVREGAVELPGRENLGSGQEGQYQNPL